MKYALKTVVAAVASLASFGAMAQDAWPSKPITMVVPYAPGGYTDTVGRITARYLEQALGVNVLVDNRAGAGGIVGTQAVARAPADGYTLCMCSAGAISIAPLAQKTGYDPLKDLAPVSIVSTIPQTVIVNNNLPVKSMDELVAYAKANPGKLNYGSPGPGSANRLEMEIFQLLTGTRLTHVPYKGGAGPAMIGLLGNEVQTMFVTFSSAVNFTRQNRVRMLGVIAPKRVAALPEIPTMAEQGFKDMVVGSWQGVFLAKGTPQAIVNRVFDVVQETMKTPEIGKRLEEGGVDVVVSENPAAFVKFVARENERFGRVIREAKIETE